MTSSNDVPLVHQSGHAMSRSSAGVTRNSSAVLPYPRYSSGMEQSSRARNVAFDRVVPSLRSIRAFSNGRRELSRVLIALVARYFDKEGENWCEEKGRSSFERTLKNYF